VEAGEYATDAAAMADIVKAWQQWKESGYTDDSLYNCSRKPRICPGMN